MAMEQNTKMILCGLLVIIGGFAGWYVGGMYDNKEIGAGVGVVAGLGAAYFAYNYLGAETYKGQMVY